MIRRCGILFGLFLVFVLFLSACGGGGGSGSSGSTSDDQFGALSIGLTDATTDEFLAVYITVKEVSVSQSIPSETDGESVSSWVVVAEPNITCNLLELVNGVIEHLGISEEIEAGHYNQMRLVLGTNAQEIEEGQEAVNILGDTEHPYANYIVYGDNETFDPEDAGTFETYELKIPSGSESGFKIVSGFDIDPDGTTDLVLDFNVVSSIVHAGVSGQWLLNPTVKALDLDESGSVEGRVYYTTEADPPEEAAIEGAIIKAQSSSEGSVTEIVSAATVSDENGGYLLNLDPGTYMIAAIAPGYQTATAEVTVATAVSVTEDFEMTAVGDETGTIYGTVNILNGLDDQFVTVYILNGDGVAINEKSVANGGSYWFDLPPGTYSMTAVFMSNGEEMTLEAYDAFEVIGGETEEFDILFKNVEESDGETETSKPEKVTICHKGKTITISSSALQAHLNHGDTEDACGTVDEETTETEGEEPVGEETETETETETDTEDSPGHVAVCHKGRTIHVSASAVSAHLAHGDSEGECE